MLFKWGELIVNNVGDVLIILGFWRAGIMVV
jgi:hypothetical protein